MIFAYLNITNSFKNIYERDLLLKNIKKTLTVRNDILVNYCDYFTTKWKTFSFRLLSNRYFLTYLLNQSALNTLFLDNNLLL